MHLWRRYRGRMVTLRWQATHTPLAFSAEDPTFGTIEVRYTGMRVENLFMSVVEVQNESNTDLTNLDLNLVFKDGTIVFVGHGGVEGSENPLPFAEPFASAFARALALAPSDPEKVRLGAPILHRRDFRVPVLNRGATARIAMLVQAEPGRQPLVNLASDHPGVRPVFRGPRLLVFGVERTLAAVVGLLAGVGIVVAMLAAPVGRTGAALLAFAVGCFIVGVGVAVVRVGRWLGRLFG